MEPQEHRFIPESRFDLYTKEMDPIREIEGSTYGEWNTGTHEDGMEEAYDVDSKIAQVLATSIVGGPRSKYRTNEDTMFILARPDRFAVGVIDGAGGSGNGLLAAQIGSTEFARKLRQEQGLVASVDEVNEAIRSNGQGGYATGVILEIDKSTGETTLVGSGDSKAITFRNEEKLNEGTTYFQNVAQEAVDEGRVAPEEYYNHGRLNIITGGFGIPEGSGKRAEITKFRTRQGDIIILATDGFWDNISEFEVEQIIKNTTTIEDVTNQLYELAYARNNAEEFSIRHDENIVVPKKLRGGDNITIAVIEIKE